MSTVYAEAPFLNVQSFTPDDQEMATPAPTGVTTAVAPWSPFLSVYESPEGESLADVGVREAYTTLVNDLYDEEFDDALFELLASARNLHQDQLASGRARHDADRVVTHHFSQLARESDRMLDAMAKELSGRDGAGVDSEIDMFADRYVPATPLEPAFQELLGKLVKKIGRGVRAVAKSAVKGAMTLGLGPILGRIKALIRPLLNRVLQKAIGRLPASIQPAARQLAERLGLASKVVGGLTTGQSGAPAVTSQEPSSVDASGVPTDGVPGSSPGGPPDDVAGSPVQGAAGPEVPEMQLEFDDLVAEALLSEDEFEWELTQARANETGEAPPVFAELDQARETFIQSLGTLKEGESAAPHIQGFIPAVLPALKIATKLIGRPRVVNFLSGLLGKLIGQLVGPTHAPALSRAIVDAGLKLVSLEATAEEESRMAQSAIAATVEETITRVASLPDHVLDNQELLEGFALEAFEQAAASNLPAVLPDATYKRRPDLLEGGVNATWVMMPLARPRYKRCSQTFKVTVTPHMAEAIEGFDDGRLAEYLEEQLGVPEGEELEAEVHLFEVLSGGTAADIVRSEAEIPGLGSADEVTMSQLQPLTPTAAGVLLGKPGLGRPMRQGADIRNVSPGQRVYHLALGRRPLATANASGRQRVRRLARVHVTLDVPADKLVIRVFLSEVKSQKLAVRLRQQAHVGSLAVGFHKLLGRRLPHILHGRRPTRLRFVHPAVTPGTVGTTLLGRLPALVPAMFITRVQEWLTTAFSEFSRTQASAFLKASEDPADGVTLVFTVSSPPGLANLGRAVGQPAAVDARVAAVVAAAPAPKVQVEVFPGYRRD